MKNKKYFLPIVVVLSIILLISIIVNVLTNIISYGATCEVCGGSGFIYCTGDVREIPVAQLSRWHVLDCPYAEADVGEENTFELFERRCSDCSARDYVANGTCQGCARTYNKWSFPHEVKVCEVCKGNGNITTEFCTHENKIMKYNNAIHWEECVDCGAVTSAGQLHDFTADETHVVTEPERPTSTSESLCLQTRKCKICEQTFEGHAFGSYLSDSDNHWQVCVLCGEDSEKNEHQWQTLTDNGDGTSECICTICKKTATVGTGEQEHVWGEWIDNKNGTHTRICSKHEEEEETESHTLDEEGNCTKCDFKSVKNNGNGTHTITNPETGEETTEEHTYEWKDNGDGTHTGECTVCRDEKTESHTLDEDENCTKCDYKKVRNNGNGTHTTTDPITGEPITEEHTFGEWTDNKKGKHTRTCTKCDEKETESHTLDEDENCTQCDFKKVKNNGNGTHTITDPETGEETTEEHTYEWKDNKNGTHTGKCTVCGDEKTESHTLDEDENCTKCDYKKEEGSESGSGSENGTGTGNGSGTGNGTGTGNGSGSGNGTGTGNGSGSGNGTGTGNGSGSGNGTGKWFWFRKWNRYRKRFWFRKWNRIRKWF